MLLDLVLLAIGTLGLYFGAEWLVKGAAGIARSFGVSTLVVGLTVVAYGTSAPELVVCSAAALEGRSGIALGNAIGSNIANIGIILGATALISPPYVTSGLIYRELPILFGATALLVVLLLDGVIGRIDGIVLLVLAAAFTLFMLKISQGDRIEGEFEGDWDPDDGTSLRTRLRLIGVGSAGLVVLVAGGELFVRGAVDLAILLGMSERVVGLTIVAFGTSLPELSASLVAALRGHSSLAVGNVIGSNIFNILLILGGAGLIAPISGSLDEMRFDIVVLVLMTVFCVYFLRTERRVSRTEGAVLLSAYVAFVVALVVLPD